MKVLFLIISDDSLPVYAEHRDVYRSYLPGHPNIDYAFITNDPTISTPTLDGDTLRIPGEEGFMRIIHKTIESIRYFDPKKYDYIVRTNLSSVWIPERLLSALGSFPKKGVYAGPFGYYKGIEFVGGCGIIVSSDVAELLCEQSENVYSVPELDDVAIGMVLHDQRNIPIIMCSKYDIGPTRVFERLPHHIWLVRVKAWTDQDRSDEPKIMRQILASVGLRS